MSSLQHCQSSRLLLPALPPSLPASPHEPRACGMWLTLGLGRGGAPEQGARLPLQQRKSFPQNPRSEYASTLQTEPAERLSLATPGRPCRGEREEESLPPGASFPSPAPSERSGKSWESLWQGDSVGQSGREAGRQLQKGGRKGTPLPASGAWDLPSQESARCNLSGWTGEPPLPLGTPSQPLLTRTGDSTSSGMFSPCSVWVRRLEPPAMLMMVPCVALELSRAGVAEPAGCCARLLGGSLLGGRARA